MLPCFSEVTPEQGEERVFTRDVVPFQEVFPYHEYEFDHEDRFGLRVYVYDIDSGGRNAILQVSTASKWMMLKTYFFLQYQYFATWKHDKNNHGIFCKHFQSSSEPLFYQACSGPEWENIAARFFVNESCWARSILSGPQADISSVYVLGTTIARNVWFQ